MVEKIQYTPNLEDHFDEVTQMYILAYTGAPLFESISLSQAQSILKTDISLPGFTSFLAVDEDKIAGASWFFTPDIGELEKMKNESIRQFAEEVMDQHQLEKIIYIQETFLRPDYQGRGLGKKLKNEVQRHIHEKYTDGTLILTSHREDNKGIISLSEQMGFQRTGLSTPAQDYPDLKNELWYKVVPRKQPDEKL